MPNKSAISNNNLTHEDRWHSDGDRVSLVRPSRTARPVNLSAHPDPLQVDLARSALVVIDMQNDFLHQDGWFARVRDVDVEPLKTPIDQINRLSAAFRSQSAPVIHLNWGIRADTANLPANVLDKGSCCRARPAYGDNIERGHILVANEWGAASIDSIHSDETDLFVYKHRLSGFRDNELDSILRRFGITTLFFTGINIDRCVFATLMDASFEGYDSILVTDACATVSPDFVSEAVQYLVRLLYGFTTTCAEVVLALDSTSDFNHSHGVST